MPLLEHPGPGAALTALDRFAKQLPGAQCTTAFCAVLNPDTGELVYSAPAIRQRSWSRPIAPRGCSMTPAPPHSDWRSISLAARRPANDAATGDLVALHTDGLVERRREPLDQGIARAADLIGDNRGATLEPREPNHGPRAQRLSGRRSPARRIASRRRWRSTFPPTPATSGPPAPPCAPR